MVRRGLLCMLLGWYICLRAAHGCRLPAARMVSLSFFFFFASSITSYRPVTLTLRGEEIFNPKKQRHELRAVFSGRVGK